MEAKELLIKVASHKGVISQSAKFYIESPEFTRVQFIQELAEQCVSCPVETKMMWGQELVSEILKYKKPFQ